MLRVTMATLACVVLLCGGGQAAVRFANPPELVSSGGVLSGTLAIRPADVRVAGRRVDFRGLYNGLYMPPVLRVQPGDTVRLTVENSGSLPTNVHYHGLNVSPLGAGDNVFIEIDPTTSFQYDMPIPSNHPVGLFWYHPHFHPRVNTEIAGGLSGGMIVGNILAPFPELAGIPERILLLKDLKVQRGAPELDPDPTGPTRRTVNGLWKPRLEMQPGQLEFWRIGNIGANIYYKLHFDGQPFYVIALDGNLKNQIVQTTTLLLPPGQRAELLVYGPRRRGTYRLRAQKFRTGVAPQGDHYPAQVLLTAVSRGPRVPQIPLPGSFPVVRDLRDVPLTGRRAIEFQDTNDPNVFTINNKVYDHSCVDTIVPLGAIEEWTVINTSEERHVFHIHQLDFQLTEVNGAPIPFTGYQDTVDLPPTTKRDGAGFVKVIIPFTNPVIVGEFVYHCHIVQHADQGMMANILVVDPRAPPPDVVRCQPSG
jgi:FtsP/CotA-like multicopper oxidase with cupredoxin domain